MEIPMDEINYLKKVLDAIKKEIIFENQEIIEIPKMYTGRYSGSKGGDEKLIDDLVKKIIERIQLLEKSVKTPYFGNFTFQAKGKIEEKKYYIGRINLDSDRENLIIDWRAPISNLYYDQRLGEVSYNSPSGIISGDLLSKNQILIKDGKLISVTDADIVSNDELLIPYLSSSVDNRLKNIIATIQQEQNEIIRRPLRDNIIIQGVAGSGKTTIAMHRIAYLIYNEPKYSSSQYVFIGPNKYFMNYISSMLPDLDTEMIMQYTFPELAISYTLTPMNLLDQNLSTKYYSTEALKYKSSMKYKEAIDNFILDYLESKLPNEIGLDDFIIATNNQIREAVFSMSPYKNSIDSYINYLSDIIRNKKHIIEKAITKKYADEAKLYQNGHPRRKELYKLIGDTCDILEKAKDKLVKPYFKNISNQPMTVYKEFITNIEKYVEGLDEKTIEQLKKNTLSSLKSKTFTFEDFPAIMYINLLMNGQKDYNDYINIIIDEAQDLGMFHFYILKQIYKRSSFSIYGDLAQSIYSYRGINDWESIKNIIFNDKAEIITINRSYRTTTEIMEAANCISKKLGLTTAEPVVRHGPKVVYEEQKDCAKIDFITNKILEFKSKNYQSIGLICKTDKESKTLYEMLNDRQVNLKNITYNDIEYNGGICTLTSSLAKGLEFDAVIITDASEKNYNSNLNTDMHLLYVAMTRALHELNILYTGQLTLPLQSANQKIGEEENKGPVYIKN